MAQKIKNSWQRGLEAEEAVAKVLSRLGWEILVRRKRLPYAEIDMIIRKKNEDGIVEVKSVSGDSEMRGYRLSKQQERRLRKAQACWQNSSGRLTRLFLAWVDEKNEIMLFNLPDGGLEYSGEKNI